MLALATQHQYVVFFDQCVESASVTHVFMAHPEAVKLYRAYPYVVLLDSTYKTNRYGYPLVELIGITPVKKSFTIAYVIMKDESIDSYKWVLEKLKMLVEEDSVPNVIVTDRELGLLAAIKETFPHSVHLLCIWHISNVVETRAKNMVKDGKLGKNIKNRWWKDVLEASTDVEFQSGWEDFQKTWPGMVSYLNNTWMPHSKKFIKCYTNKVMHFGNTTTSRVESSHAALKLCLVNSALALDTVWKRTHTLLEGQHVDIRNSLEQSCSVHIPSNHGRLFSSLAGHVATYAIILMHEEYDRGVVLGVGLNERCGCTIVTTHGLLCACKLHDLHRKGQRVHLQDVHLFWRTLRYNQAGSMPESDLDHLDSLFEGVRASDPSLRRIIAETIHRQLHPEDEDLEDPVENETRKGRPRRSTSRNPSGVEYARKKYPTPNNSPNFKRPDTTSSQSRSTSTQHGSTYSTFDLPSG
ncbi:PKS-NRPS hybrid synthetase cheA [Linum perenne]